MFGKSERIRQLEHLLGRAGAELQLAIREVDRLSGERAVTAEKLAAREREVEKLELEVERWKGAYLQAMQGFAQRALGLPNLTRDKNPADPFAEDPKRADVFMSPDTDAETTDYEAVERLLQEQPPETELTAQE